MKKRAGHLVKKGWEKGKRLTHGARKFWDKGVKRFGERLKHGAEKAKELYGLVKKHKGDLKAVAGWIGRHGFKGEKKRAMVKKTKDMIRKQFGPIAKQLAGGVRKKLGGLIKLLGKHSPQVKAIQDALKNGSKVLDFMKHPEKLAKMGKEKAVEYLTKTAMKALDKPLRKANEFLVEQAMKLMKSPVTQAIATGVSGAVSGAVASVTAGAGAFLQPLLQPLAKMSADKMVDWGIDKVKSKIGDLLFKQTKGLIADHVMKPLVNKGYDKLMDTAKHKFPKAFATAERGVDAMKKGAAAADKVVGGAIKVTEGIQKLESGATKAHDDLGKVEQGKLP